MQLLLILALLLYGGKNGAGNVLSEVRPILESIGGEDIKETLKSAEEITEVLSAVQTFADGLGGDGAGLKDIFGGGSDDRPWSGDKADDVRERAEPAIAFPLSPISDIADREITYSLSKYISQSMA